jgi:hypothetical protein
MRLICLFLRRGERPPSRNSFDFVERLNIDAAIVTKIEISPGTPKRWPDGGVKAGLQLGFDAFSLYNIAPHTLSLIGAAPANNDALNIHPWWNDARSHYQ